MYKKYKKMYKTLNENRIFYINRTQELKYYIINVL